MKHSLTCRQYSTHFRSSQTLAECSACSVQWRRRDDQRPQRRPLRCNENHDQCCHSWVFSRYIWVFWPLHGFMDILWQYLFFFVKLHIFLHLVYFFNTIAFDTKHKTAVIDIVTIANPPNASRSVQYCWSSALCMYDSFKWKFISRRIDSIVKCLLQTFHIKCDLTLCRHETYR